MTIRNVMRISRVKIISLIGLVLFSLLMINLKIGGKVEGIDGAPELDLCPQTEIFDAVFPYPGNLVDQCSPVPEAPLITLSQPTDSSISTPPSVSVDLCLDIVGVQEVYPYPENNFDGCAPLNYIQNINGENGQQGGTVDLCPNLSGEQLSYPFPDNLVDSCDSMMLIVEDPALPVSDPLQPEAMDLCPFIDGVQEIYPYPENTLSPCDPPIDVCPDVDGLQLEFPFPNHPENPCIDIPTDLCPIYPDFNDVYPYPNQICFPGPECNIPGINIESCEQIIAQFDGGEAGAGMCLLNKTYTGEGWYDVSFRLVITNTSKYPISNINFYEDLDLIFAPNYDYTITSMSTDGYGLTLNPNFNGKNDKFVLDNSATTVNRILGRTTANVDFTMRIRPVLRGTYYNSSAASFVFYYIPVDNLVYGHDITMDGCVPDTNDDGIYIDESNPTPVDFSFDLCMNTQTIEWAYPYPTNTENGCEPPLIDLCPNIAGVQSTYPYPKHLTNMCVAATDVCPELVGDQEYYPYIVDGEYSCYRPVARVITYYTGKTVGAPMSGVYLLSAQNEIVSSAGSLILATADSGGAYSDTVFAFYKKEDLNLDQINEDILGAEALLF